MRHSNNNSVKPSRPLSSNSMRNPLDIIEMAHQVHAQICDALEAIADSLPDEVDRRLAANVADCLCIELPLHHLDEEEGLFPLLEKRALPEDNIVDILSRLAIEHATDESFADELGESLKTLGRGERVDNPNMVGYMLRGFFENYRRHLHWENTLVLPLARQRLKKKDLTALFKILETNRTNLSKNSH